MKKYNLFLLVTNIILIGIIVCGTFYSLFSGNCSWIRDDSDIVTYKSKDLGGSFNIPDKLVDNCVVSENGKEIRILIKDDAKSDEAVVIITSDIKAYNRGKDMSSIDGRSKYRCINNCGYLIGLSEECSEDLLISNIKDIVNTLR